MLQEQLMAFKNRHNIPSADKWAEISGVSKSTIIRALKGNEKNMGVKTLEMLIAPYNGSIDELLNIGAYSPEAIEKEEIKNEINEKIETVVEIIENSEDISQEPTEEIVSALAEVQEYINNDTSDYAKCSSSCTLLKEMVISLKVDKEKKDIWLYKLFRLTFVLTGTVLVLIVIAAALLLCLINQ